MIRVVWCCSFDVCGLAVFGVCCLLLLMCVVCCLMCVVGCVLSLSGGACNSLSFVAVGNVLLCVVCCALCVGCLRCLLTECANAVRCCLPVAC